MLVVTVRTNGRRLSKSRNLEITLRLWEGIPPASQIASETHLRLPASYDMEKIRRETLSKTNQKNHKYCGHERPTAGNYLLKNTFISI